MRKLKIEDNDITLRLEEPKDYKEVENLTREAFWNVNSLGCNEHYLMHIMRNSQSFISELCYVAVYNGKIIGNIAYTHAVILSDVTKHAVISFGPLSVLPEFQKRGIGSRLILKTKELALQMGHKAILIYGDPDYYCRFGFIPAEALRIQTSNEMYSPALLVLELTPGALSGISGSFCEDFVFEVDLTKSEEFDKTFPKKEKLVTPSQARFNQLISRMHK
ncbi:MAG: N-acetyltransferase [Lachnospiraceae bacterium]|nr:N-acetyltransferase [Lachnospiraceae bacterium]